MDGHVTTKISQKDREITKFVSCGALLALTLCTHGASPLLLLLLDSLIHRDKRKANVYLAMFFF